MARILLSERDIVLFNSCRAALAECPANGCVVAVVGESHVPGMRRMLTWKGFNAPAHDPSHGLEADIMPMSAAAASDRASGRNLPLK